VFVTIKPSAFSSCVEMSPTTEGFSALTPEQLLCASLTTLRAAASRASSADDPDRWAAAQLALGAVLRLRARGMDSAKRATAYVESIETFEAALAVYCRFGHPEVSSTGSSCSDRHPGSYDDRRVVAHREGSSAEMDGVDLILQATSRPMMMDMESLAIAEELLREGVTPEVHAADFHTWLVNMINLGCSQTLMGKRAGSEGDCAQLEEAIDTFRELLRERGLLDMPFERAIVHINLADALRAMSSCATPDDRLEYLESSADSLATALSLVAPQKYRRLLELPLARSA
jgi:hypothetical protein